MTRYNVECTEEMMKEKIFLIVVLLFWVSLPVFAQMTAQEIIDEADAVASVAHSYFLYDQVVLTAGNVKTSYTIEAYTKNGNEKQLLRYREPSKVRGTAFLLLDHGDNIWAYFSSSGRVRLIAKHMKKEKMMGSEFTYEDMAMSSIKRNYSGTLMGETKIQKRRCYQLELTPKGESSYEKVAAFVDKENYVVLQLDFYKGGEDEPFKRMVQGKVEVVDGIPTPFLIVMKNLKTGAQTAIKIVKIDYSTPVEESLFTTSGLQR